MSDRRSTWNSLKEDEAMILRGDSKIYSWHKPVQPVRETRAYLPDSDRECDASPWDGDWVLAFWKSGVHFLCDLT